MLFKSNRKIGRFVPDRIDKELFLYLFKDEDFLKYLSETSEERLRNSEKEIIFKNNYLTVYEDRTIVLQSPRKDWIGLGTLYIASNTSIPQLEEELNRFLLFAQKNIEIKKNLTNSINKIKEEFYTLQNIKSQFLFYSFIPSSQIEELMKKEAVQFVESKETYSFLVKDIIIAGIFYEEIEVVTDKTFYLKSLKVKVNSKEFSTGVIHPCLPTEGWGYNNFLYYLPTNKLKSFESLIKEIKGQSNFINDIVLIKEQLSL